MASNTLARFARKFSLFSFFFRLCFNRRFISAALTVEEEKDDEDNDEEEEEEEEEEDETKEGINDGNGAGSA